MTEPYADRIPMDSTVITVKHRMPTLNKLPKVPALQQIAAYR